MAQYLDKEGTSYFWSKIKKLVGDVQTTLQTNIDNKQDILTAGDNITIDSTTNTISSNIDVSGKQDKLTAGTGIDITNNIISATGDNSDTKVTQNVINDTDTVNLPVLLAYSNGTITETNTASKTKGLMFSQSNNKQNLFLGDATYSETEIEFNNGTSSTTIEQNANQSEDVVLDLPPSSGTIALTSDITSGTDKLVEQTEIDETDIESKYYSALLANDNTTTTTTDTASKSNYLKYQITGENHRLYVDNTYYGDTAISLYNGVASRTTIYNNDDLSSNIHLYLPKTGGTLLVEEMASWIDIGTTEDCSLDGTTSNWLQYRVKGGYMNIRGRLSIDRIAKLGSYSVICTFSDGLGLMLGDTNPTGIAWTVQNNYPVQLWVGAVATVGANTDEVGYNWELKAYFTSDFMDQVSVTSQDDTYYNVSGVKITFTMTVPID